MKENNKHNSRTCFGIFNACSFASVKTTTCVEESCERPTSSGIFLRWGFTLIELLVVVLIIGVLAAIAVPQYQKAVLKSRFSSLMPTTQAIRDGNEMYYMTNGRYANDVAKLDVTTANTEDMTITLSDDDDYAYTLATRPNIKNNLIMYQKHSANFPGEIHCEALQTNKHANWLCERGLGGRIWEAGSLTGGYNTYILEGTGKGLPLIDEKCEDAVVLGLTCKVSTNEQGKLVKQVCVDEFCRTKTYNDDGSYTSVTCRVNSEHTCVEYTRYATYDKNGNKIFTSSCLKKNLSSDGTCRVYESGNYVFTYDEKGNKLSQIPCTKIASDGTCSKYADYGNFYTYDAAGNITSERYCTKGAKADRTCTTYNTWGNNDYTYDANGNMTSKRTCSEVGSDGKCTTYDTWGNNDYTYDANGNMISSWTCSTVGTDGKCSEYSSSSFMTYDANGNRISNRDCNGFDNDGKCTEYSQYNNFDYTYDTAGNKTSERFCRVVGDNGICSEYSTQRTEYTYDSKGNQTSQLTCNKISPNGTCETYSDFSYYNKYYTYDTDGNQLTARVCGKVNSDKTCGAYSSNDAYDYTYDTNGNEVAKMKCMNVGADGKCKSYYGGFDISTYDPNGNIISKKQCSQVSAVDRSCTTYYGTTYVYTYDEDGKKIATQQCSSNNLNSSTGDCVVKTIYDVEKN